MTNNAETNQQTAAAAATGKAADGTDLSASDYYFDSYSHYGIHEVILIEISVEILHRNSSLHNHATRKCSRTRCAP